MARIQLTDLAVQKLPHPERGQVKYRDTTLPGFGLIVGKTTKTFFVTYGKERRNLTIGRYPSISLKSARRRALEHLDSATIETRPTRLRELVRAYMDDCEQRLRPESLRRFRGILERAPDISIEKVTKKLATTSHEVAAYKAMFNWGIREGMMKENPFAYMKATYGKRDRVLSDEEIKAMWHYDHPPYSHIVKLLLLTGQRRNQIWRLLPEWISGDTITFPGDVMKNGENHTIPFGDITRTLLAPPFQFNSWGKAKDRMDKQTGLSNYTIHDLRRTFATVHARLGTPIHVTEAHLDHRSGTISGITAVYVRHNFIEEARKAASTYEQHIAKIVGL